MAQIAEILKEEKERGSQEARRRIHFFEEGSFFRAYEWSAWLMCLHYPDLRVTKRKFKSLDEPVVFVGFPLTSIGKYAPHDVTAQPQPDKSMVLQLPEEALGADWTAEALLEDFARWKESLPLSESKKQAVADEKERLLQPMGQAFRPQRITEVMQQIMAFPVEKKSPIDCMLFLAQIKEQLAQLI